MDFVILIVAAMMPPSAMLYGTVRAWRTWTSRWRVALVLPGALSIAAIVTTLLARVSETEAGSFVVVFAYLSFLLAAAFIGGIVVLIHAAQGAAQAPTADISNLP